jgi:predicted RNase H-like nuclease (RuvC/YqgF family)
MGFLAIILSSLALLAVIANTVLMIRERKRNQKRNTAQMNYVDESIRPIGEQFGKLDARIKDLESGVVPGFDERIKKLEREISDLEYERDNLRGLFKGSKRKKIQEQIDELKRELNTLK